MHQPYRYITEPITESTLIITVYKKKPKSITKSITTTESTENGKPVDYHSQMTHKSTAYSNTYLNTYTYSNKTTLTSGPDHETRQGTVRKRKQNLYPPPRRHNKNKHRIKESKSHKKKKKKKNIKKKKKK